MDGKSRNSWSSIAPYEHEYYCIIWELVKSGRLEELDGERKILGELMLEHDEYQYFWEVPYAFVETEIENAFEQGAVLSYADLSAMLGCGYNTITNAVKNYKKKYA